MASPLLAIREPRWTRPALLDTSRTFQLVLESSPVSDPVVTLRRGHEEVPIDIKTRSPLRPGLTSYTCIAPESTAGGLYDLDVLDLGLPRSNGRESDATVVTVPHAVGILEPIKSLSLLHCSDLHIVKLAPPGVLEDRSALVSALIARINALSPDLVVCTGDLITRYDPEKNPLPADHMRRQIEHVRELLRDIKVPFFLTTGNHDVAFADIRSDWYAAMGGGWHGHTDDFSIDVGEIHLTMMDCFGHYDANNVMLDSSFTPEQVTWLRQDVEAASASRMRLVFIHYDYRKQLPSLLGNLPIDILFYGHDDVGLEPELFSQTGVLNGHLAGYEAYNLITLNGNGITSTKVTWDEMIAVSSLCANEGEIT